MSPLKTLSHARPALAAFAAMGVLWGSFAADLPDIKAMLGVDEAQLGLYLLLTPVAAVGAMLIAPKVGALFGRFALPIACALMALGFALPAQAPLVLFPLAMMAAGAGTGLTDVLMNARVAALENDRGLPLMNLCHAAYSFGYAGGALATGALRQAGFAPPELLTGMACLAAVLALASFETDGKITGLTTPKGQTALPLGLLPILGGAMVLVAFMTENAAENWSALHIEKTLGGSATAGAMGPALMAMTMGLARLGGQSLAARLPALRLLTLGAAVSATGTLIAAAALNPMMAYAGFIIMGIGSSVIAPTAFSLVGQRADPRSRARAVARATLFGYFGYFFGPPLVGLIAGGVGLRFAFVFAAALLALVPLLARSLIRRS